MIFEFDFKKIIDSIPVPILVAEKITGNGSAVFVTRYINAAFDQQLPAIAAPDVPLSTAATRLFGTDQWEKAATTTDATGIQQTFTSADKTNTHWYRTTISMTNQPDCIISSLTDISDAMKQNTTLAELTGKLKYAANHDPLTGLPNRNQLQEDLASAVQYSTRSKKPFAILLLDIDNMKITNDSQGHAAGDELLCLAATIFRQFSRDTIKIYRFGGDEFIILADHLNNRDTMLTIGDTILEQCYAAGFTFSGGIAVYPDDTQKIDELLKYADMAMYEVKRLGKCDIMFFKSAMQNTLLNKLDVQAKMSRALEQRLFKLYFQPQFDIATNKLRGFEALLRWHDDERGWIPPEEFIPIAEENSQIIPIGAWVLEKAVATTKKWQDLFHFSGIMSVNVSPVQLKKTSFIFDLAECIERYALDPRTLEIEITEGILIENRTEIISLLNQIRQMGIGISLDDFGTGYSSLSYLQQLPITTLKIDKSFIANIAAKNGIEANITDSIISMVNKMGLDTIAEGVENADQLAILRTINCKTVQGFLKGKPMPEELCEAVIAGSR
jgi:diguanylate cyclase (GGDEF)-like protein